LSLRAGCGGRAVNGGKVPAGVTPVGTFDGNTSGCVVFTVILLTGPGGGSVRGAKGGTKKKGHHRWVMALGRLLLLVPGYITRSRPARECRRP
jgi:hypothetical protein